MALFASFPARERPLVAGMRPLVATPAATSQPQILPAKTPIPAFRGAAPLLMRTKAVVAALVRLVSASRILTAVPSGGMPTVFNAATIVAAVVAQMDVFRVTLVVARDVIVRAVSAT